MIDFFDNNLGGLIAGVIVAIFQLVVVYFWIEKRVEKIQLKSEGRKWKEARKELDATLLSLGYSLSQPLAYYTILRTNGVCFRENYHVCLDHVAEKSQTLDSMLAIYSIGLAPESFTIITQLADQLRSIAGNAKAAAHNWEKIAMDFPSVDEKGAKVIHGIRRATKSIEFEVPKDPTERFQKLFAYYTLQTIHGISEISDGLNNVSQTQFDLKELNQTSRYKRLMNISKMEQTAFKDYENTKKHVEKMKAIVKSMEFNGICLATVPEVD